MSIMMEGSLIGKLRLRADAYEHEIINSKVGVKKEFITKLNINNLFQKYNVPNNVDLLVIDIDENDYHIWKEIKIKPTIIMIEFN